MMLIRSSLPSSNPVTLPDTVHLLSEAESKTEKKEFYTTKSALRAISCHHLIRNSDLTAAALCVQPGAH